MPLGNTQAGSEHRIHCCHLGWWSPLPTVAVSSTVKYALCGEVFPLICRPESYKILFHCKSTSSSVLREKKLPTVHSLCAMHNIISFQGKLHVIGKDSSSTLFLA